MAGEASLQEVSGQQILPDISGRMSVYLLAFVCAGFLLLRLPVMYLQPGGQDEDCYAIPGLEVLRHGSPKMPHLPARHLESIFFKADKELYSEPPAYFYFQALFYAFLPDVYGTGRLASAVAGVVVLMLVYHLTVAATGRYRAAVWAILLFSLSRWFLFPATSARPDMLCSAFGVSGIVMIFRWTQVRRYGWLVGAGICIGLGGLTHPFAIVYAIQMAFWVGLASTGWNRVRLPLLLAMISILVAGLWLPLILREPEAFRVQFSNQFLSGAGGSLSERILFPWESIRYHWLIPDGMIAHIGPWQSLLTFVPLVVMTALTFRRGNRTGLTVCLLAWSSIYLMCVIIGPHHPVFGYWGYSAAFMFVPTGMFVDELTGRIIRLSSRWRPVLMRRTAVAAIGLLLVLSMVPGSGLRTVAVLIRQRNNPDYNAPVFAKRLMDSLPEKAVVAVDTQFVFDFVVKNRNVLLATGNKNYLRLEDFRCDYLVVSRAAIDTNLTAGLPLDLISTMGVKDDLFACYCEIYRYRHRDQ